MDMRPQVKKKRIDVNDFLEPGNESINKEKEQVIEEKKEVNVKEEPKLKDTKPKINHGKRKKSPPNKMAMIIATIGVIGSIALITVVGSKLMKANTSDQLGAGIPEQSENTSIDVNGTLDLRPGNIDGDAQQIKPGMVNPSESTTMTQNSEVEPDIMVKDLNGLSLIQNYTVAEVKTVTDFINYKKHRSVTADGMELLWLEADYKGKAYKVTVPFSIYKELEPEGITVVDMEVLDLGNGSSIISYMKVREDYKKKLDNGLR